MQNSFDIVAVFGNKVERCFDIVASEFLLLLNPLALHRADCYGMLRRKPRNVLHPV